MKITVAGTGPGSPYLYTEEMKEAVENADTVLTALRTTEYLHVLNRNVLVMSVSDITAYLDKHCSEATDICVAAGGDTGFYSIASTIAARMEGKADVRYICGISSMQYFAAAAGHSYENMKLVSFHGRNGSLVPYVCYNKSVFALTGGRVKAGSLIKDLAASGLGSTEIFAGENLTLENQRIVRGKASELIDEEFGDLTVMIADNIGYSDKYRTLKDSEFIRGRVPMTKEAVRILAAAELEIKPTDVVYDIGAGTGAASCAFALKANENFVYAAEKKAEGIELIKANMNRLGIRNIRLIEGSAPECMREFPPADKAFIGGSGNLENIVQTILSKNNQTMILITAVSLETLHEAISIFEKTGIEPAILCANIASADRKGRHTLMKAENPIYLIKGEKQIDG